MKNINEKKKSRKTETIHVRITTEEKDLIKKNAQKNKMKLSQYIIYAATNPQALRQNSIDIPINNTFNYLYNHLMANKNISYENKVIIEKELDEIYEELRNAADKKQFL